MLIHLLTLVTTINHLLKKVIKNYGHFVTVTAAKSILISSGARLAPFEIAELREIMSYDEMELDTYQKRAKVPSQELSDYLVKELTKKEK